MTIGLDPEYAAETIPIAWTNRKQMLQISQPSSKSRAIISNQQSLQHRFTRRKTIFYKYH